MVDSEFIYLEIKSPLPGEIIRSLIVFGAHESYAI
jgi:hypothetical protein